MMSERPSNDCCLTSKNGAQWLGFGATVPVTPIQKLLIILDIANPYFFSVDHAKQAFTKNVA